MASPETKSQKEAWGGKIRNGGIIAALIGLLAQSSGLVLGGAGLVASGEIFRSLGKKSQPKTA